MDCVVGLKIKIFKQFLLQINLVLNYSAFII